MYQKQARSKKEFTPCTSHDKQNTQDRRRQLSPPTITTTRFFTKLCNVRFNLKDKVVNILVPLHYDSTAGKKPAFIDNVLTALLKSEVAPPQGQKRKTRQYYGQQDLNAKGTS
ncbi:uncharacterized protein FMAN_13713 [Fusarium mangiferae]|uniref:Uncharacterized protein n=1 Tax=Fusarium mangiferae TaxID=192010 RepID=A0A1L7TI10_FUSMA|nr:uncharacterized protein FMAN_13713 [Fusarium mangiferae]CVK95783.1 uncharacterized protein FMAN_13713 [Fusarium mangiferae]